jgi:hypothetical protein
MGMVQQFTALLQDKLMTVPSTESLTGSSSGSWLFKNKEHGKASAAASLVSFWYLSLCDATRTYGKCCMKSCQSLV